MTRRAIATAVMLLLATEARAYVRETTTSGNPASGKCLYWGTRTVPYVVNATSAANPPNRAACPDCAPCLNAAAAVGLISATLPAWNNATQAGAAQACTSFALQYAGTSTSVALGNDGANLLVFRTGWCGNPAIVPVGDACRLSAGACATKYNCWEHDGSGTIGLTTITYVVGTGQIIDSDIEFHGWDGNPVQANGYYLTCAASPSCSPSPWGPPPEANCASVDVGSVALHEAGHVVGLDHTCVYPAPYDSCTPNSVMQPTITSGTTRRTLDADDVAGICAIYPRNGETATCNSSGGSSSGSSSGGGCSSGGQGGVLALAAAAMALFRTRRRTG